MIIEKKFYDDCCPAYKKAIDKLEQTIVDIKNKNAASHYFHLCFPDYEIGLPSTWGSKSQNRINTDFNEVLIAQEIQSEILKFSRDYLTPFEYWDLYMELICFIDGREPNIEVRKERFKEIAKRPYFHVHYEEIWEGLQHGKEEYFTVFYSKYFKQTNFKNEVGNDVKERDLCFPHSHLRECFRSFEIHASRLPSSKLVKRYKEMTILYVKILFAYCDVVEWFKLLVQANDVTFVKHNVEFRLGENLLDVKLWKLYLQFLKEHGQYKWLLKTYSKYCRFFLDDEEMLEKYRKDMTEHGPVKLPWENLFDFENVEEEESSDEDSATEISNFDMEEPLNESICVNFYGTCKVQDFALPKPLVRYILENANHRLLRKLFSSCKYFYAKHPTPICYGLYTKFERGFRAENLSLGFSENLDMLVKNTYITGILYFTRQKYIGFELPEDSLFMSSLIPRLYRCEAKYIRLIAQKLTFNELKFLIQHGCVVELDIRYSHILNENGDFVDFEKIMEFLPNVEKFYLPNIKVNAKTGHVLSRLSLNGKLTHFDIARIYGEPFDQKEFLKFCIANRDKKLTFLMIFDKDFNAAFVENFEAIFDDYKKSCKNYDDKFQIYKYD